MKRILSAILAAVMMLSITPVANIFTNTAITAEAASYYYVNSSSGLNLRKGPSTSYAVILKMPNGAKVKYLGSKSNGFYKVSYTKNGKTYTGYCSSSYLRSSSTASISSSDKKYILELLSQFYYVPVSSYSSSSSSAKTAAYETLMGFLAETYKTIFKHYGWSYTEYTCNSNSKFKVNDPKGYSKSHFVHAYQKLSASKVDWILKNVYNVTPDHSKVVKYYDTVTAYYYNGYYYHICNEGGDVCPDYKITSCTKSNGYYIIKGGAYWYNNTKDGSFSAKLKLKTVDGKKVWSIYSYSLKKV